MIHKPIQIKNLSLTFPHKICFEDFSATVLYGNRIAIIGRNGGGKSTLLKIIQGLVGPSEGEIIVPKDIVCGYVPQIVENFDSLSGGERFNQALTDALRVYPNLFLLDEPTNHLDRKNRKSLMRMLQNYPGTLIVASHDTELLRNCIDMLWHIENGKIRVFSGKYDDYMREKNIQHASLESEISIFKKQQKGMHQDLMKEQVRAAKSRAKGEKNIDQHKWPTIVSKAKSLRAEETTGRKKSSINNKKSELLDKLSELYCPEIIKPTFSFVANDVDNRVLVTIHDGCAGYKENENVLTNVNFSVMSNDRVAIVGDNGSGKSTLIKAILGNPEIIKFGEWQIAKYTECIGYLDQHYKNIDPEKTVLQTISELVPNWSHADVRRLLNDFLFRKNEEVFAKVATLSGGEKARLSLAKIAANTPKLLILDEVTNNLDLETREHVIQVLKEYPGAIIIISHDEDFLKEIDVSDYYALNRK